MCNLRETHCGTETAPLLQEDGETGIREANPSFGDRVGGIAQEPLTPLTKVLLILALALLLLSSVSPSCFVYSASRA
jgi:hypothetical protein